MQASPTWTAIKFTQIFRQLFLIFLQASSQPHGSLGPQSWPPQRPILRRPNTMSDHDRHKFTFALLVSYQPRFQYRAASRAIQATPGHLFKMESKYFHVDETILRQQSAAELLLNDIKLQDNSPKDYPLSHSSNNLRDIRLSYPNSFSSCFNSSLYNVPQIYSSRPLWPSTQQPPSRSQQPSRLPLRKTNRPHPLCLRNSTPLLPSPVHFNHPGRHTNLR